MPFINLFPSLPWPFIDIVMNVIAGLGALLITYAIFLEAERKQDAVFVIASACLLTYAIWMGNKIFSVAMIGVLVGSFIELAEITLGHHRHTDLQVEKYRNPKK